MKDESRSLLAAELAKYNIKVHQPGGPVTMTREPQSPMVPVHWQAADLERLLKRLGEEVSLEAGGDRRTLRLANPGLPFGTTPTFWGSIQHILPGEIATAHRHAPHAFRFIMKGHGAVTTVNGERYAMNEGDLVITPAGTWHDHEHLGSEPMTWLDGLDISLVAALHAMYFEPYPANQQPVTASQDSSARDLAYPWARAEGELRALARGTPDLFDDFVLEYRNPVTGGPIFQTLGLGLQWLRPATHTKVHRHTGSALYYVVRGEGATLINGTRFDWAQGDFFSLPPWAWHEHLNRSTRSEAVLFRVDDLPAMKALGLYREEHAKERQR
jgi:gentisate 1,2-dioxygenase